MRVDDTAGIVFALMVREHNIATLLRKIFLAVGLGENEPIDFDKTDDVAYDGVTMFRCILFFVPYDVVHTKKIIDFMKDTDYYNIIKSKHKRVFLSRVL